MRKLWWSSVPSIVMACGAHDAEAGSAAQIFSDPGVAQLASAACDGDSEAVRRALEAGADVNGRGRNGFTPLVWAITCRSADGVRGLLANGADPNVRMDDGASAMWLAATYKDPIYLKTLAQFGGDLNGDEADRGTSALLGGLTSGFQNGTWENYYFALDAGADVNARYGPRPGITVAEKAVGLGLFDKALELLDRGYSRDLDKLARFAGNRVIDESSPQSAFKRALLERLSTRESDAS